MENKWRSSTSMIFWSVIVLTFFGAINGVIQFIFGGIDIVMSIMRHLDKISGGNKAEQFSPLMNISYISQFILAGLYILYYIGIKKFQEIQNNEEASEAVKRVKTAWWLDLSALLLQALSGHVIFFISPIFKGIAGVLSLIALYVLSDAFGFLKAEPSWNSTAKKGAGQLMKSAKMGIWFFWSMFLFPIILLFSAYLLVLTNGDTIQSIIYSLAFKNISSSYGLLIFEVIIMALILIYWNIAQIIYKLVGWYNIYQGKMVMAQVSASCFCSKCGTPIKENTSFCSKCGTKIEHEVNEEDTETESFSESNNGNENDEEIEDYDEEEKAKRRKLWIISGCAGAVALIAGILIFAFSGSKKWVLTAENGLGPIKPGIEIVELPSKYDGLYDELREGMEYDDQGDEMPILEAWYKNKFRFKIWKTFDEGNKSVRGITIYPETDIVFSPQEGKEIKPDELVIDIMNKRTNVTAWGNWPYTSASVGDGKSFEWYATVSDIWLTEAGKELCMNGETSLMAEHFDIDARACELWVNLERNNNYETETEEENIIEQAVANSENSEDNEDTLYRTGTHKLSGFLDGKYEITMHLSWDEAGQVSGSYFYGDGKYGSINLSGWIFNNHTLELSETTKDEVTGTWKLSIINNLTIEGTMTNNKDKTFHVILSKE